MKIPRSYIENYSAALNTVSERSREALIDALSTIDYTADIADVRNAVIAVMQPACGASTTVAARLAADFYDGLRLQFGIDDGYKASIETMREPEATDGAVRAFVQDLVDDKPIDQFIGKCADRIDSETRRAANECIAFNAQQDPEKPRWARVPVVTPVIYKPWSKERGVTHNAYLAQHGTCQFCMMLASRGFVYHSEELASHAHPGCDCRVIPSWDKKNPAIQGYDPAEYFDKWKHPEKYKQQPAGNGSSGSQQQWAKQLNVSLSQRTVGLPSGQAGKSLKTAKCDIYTTGDGIELIFPQGMDASKQGMTPERAVLLLDRVPAEIRANMQRQIFFVDYENPQDAYWRRVYKSFTRSYATGGDEITFYKSAQHNDDYVVRSYCHEAGHYIDKQNGAISGERKWKLAMTADRKTSGKPSPTKYGENSNAEDFAESVALWATNRADFEVKYPRRTKIIKSLVV